ncbi:hypothetical protein BD410DRAFT_539732 [Rickenella mellea]|uniref:Uncharacterized protein n=1 Tax=Rickenella mellea TaxID=50990 RepID=A0A4Y7PRE3_9AGAM|nr:hypothetical protein BD410DRAFT_539732 [Rickenella mellea]
MSHMHITLVPRSLIFISLCFVFEIHSFAMSDIFLSISFYLLHPHFLTISFVVIPDPILLSHPPSLPPSSLLPSHPPFSSSPLLRP